jgi:chaperonin GroEL
MINIQNKSIQDVHFGLKALNEINKGAEILAKAVGSTMGPSGHNVIIDRNNAPPFITKDGVTVAKSINLKQKLPSIGAELLKEIASKTNELCGDGTTSSTVLGYAMLSEGMKMIATGRSSIGIKKGMDIGSKKIIDCVKKAAKNVRGKEDIINVGTISANGDREIGELLTNAIEKVGENGIITVEAAKSFKTSLDIVEGMQLESGYVSPYFVTNHEKLTTEYEDCWVLNTNKKLSSLSELINVLEKVADSNKALLIIADEIEGEALHTLIVNKMKGVLKVVAIKCPSYGENRLDMLNDIKALVGGEVFDASSATPLKDIEYEHLGICKKVIVGRGFTTLIGNLSVKEEKERLDSRIESIKSALANDGTLDELRKSNYKKRLAKLAGGIAVVKVGGSTEVEIMEKKDRVEDALNATIAAVQEGIVPGGGTALFFASLELDKWLRKNRNVLTEDEQAGIQIIINSCKFPLKTIIENTGMSYEVVANSLIKNRNKPNFGYDAAKHEYCNLIEKGIIDPVKVERYAVEFASSVISLLLSCNAYVVNESISFKDKKDESEE